MFNRNDNPYAIYPDPRKVIAALTTLGLPIDKTFTVDELHEHYRKLAKGYHPDSGSSAFSDGEQFKKLSEAYEFIKKNYIYVDFYIKNDYKVIFNKGTSREFDPWKSGPSKEEKKEEPLSEFERLMIWRYPWLSKIRPIYKKKTIQSASVHSGTANKLIFRAILDKDMSKPIAYSHLSWDELVAIAEGSNYSWEEYLLALYNASSVIEKAWNDAKNKNVLQRGMLMDMVDDKIGPRLRYNKINEYAISVESIVASLKDDIDGINTMLKRVFKFPRNYIDFSDYVDLLQRT